MKPIEILGIIILPIVFFTSCVTTSYHKSNKQYAHMNKEFYQKSRGSYHIYSGVYHGQVNRNNKKYHHVQFSGMLKGEKRYLNFYLAEDSSEETIIFESSTPITGRECAYLILQRYCCMEPEQHRALLFEKGKKTSDAAIFMKKHFNYRIGTEEYPIILCNLDLSNVFKYTMIYIVWEKGTGNPVVAQFGIDAVVSYDTANIQIEWHERSRVLYAMRMVGYVGTLALDIVTAPFQLIALLIYGASGPVK